VSPVCLSGRAHRGLDGDRWAGGERRRSPWARSAAEDGEGGTFLVREEWRRSRQGKKVPVRRCGRGDRGVSRPSARSGHPRRRGSAEGNRLGAQMATIGTGDQEETKAARGFGDVSARKGYCARPPGPARGLRWHSSRREPGVRDVKGNARPKRVLSSSVSAARRRAAATARRETFQPDVALSDPAPSDLPTGDWTAATLYPLAGETLRRARTTA
jgi:hypothetical protein